MSNRGPDIVRRDENGAPVAVVEIKNTIRPGDRAYFLRQLGNYLRASGSARYSILVDPADIEVFEGDPAEQHSWTLRTREILTRYDAKFADRRDIYEGYLNTLITAWLDDLSFHAAQKRFPEEDRLPKGLLDALRAA